MARIQLINNFVLIPEGKHIFRVYDATYDETFGKIEVKLVNAQGMTHTERFSIQKKNGEMNESALGAFSYFAKTTLNDYSLNDVDPKELIDHYIEAEVRHIAVQSNNDPNKLVTFANLGEKRPAYGFSETPVERALTIGKDKKHTDINAPSAKQTTTSPSIDLNTLLG